MNTQDFLTALFPNPADGYIEIRVLPSRAQAVGTREDLSQLDAFIQAHITEDVYFGVATRVEKEGRLRGGAAHCHVAHVLWADFDFKNMPEDKARAYLDLCPTPPSIVVQSGGGLHVYWLLKEPILADGTLKSWLRRLALTLKADMASAEPARVLRLPGTLNHKYTPPRPVRLETLEPDRRYTLADFAWLRDEEPKAESTGRPQYSIGVLDLDKAVNVLSKLWPGNNSGQRHQFAQHVGGWLAHNSVAEDDAVALVRRVAEAAGDDDAPDRERVVRDSYAAFSADRPTTGLPKAFELVPELKDVLPILNDALGIVPRPLITVEDNAEPLVLLPAEQLALPAEARIGLAKRYADLYAEAYESPWENFYFAFLTHLGARVAKHLRMDDDLGTEPRLYTILLAPSGVGKSEAINKAAADFAWADLGHDPDPQKAEPERFSIVHGVGSGEALAEALEQSPKRQVIFQPDEFAHVANKMRIEGSSLTSILNSLFENATWDNRVKGKAYAINGASLSFLTACVDDVFPTLFDSRGGADQGIVNRFWIVTGPSSVDPKPSPRVSRMKLDEIRRQLYQTLAAFKNMTPYQHKMVHLKPEAQALYDTWYRTEYFPMRRDSKTRLRTYARRLMMLGALTTATSAGISVAAATEFQAGPEVVQATIAMLRWQDQIRRRSAPIIADTAAAKVELTILRAFEQAGGQGLTLRDAQRVTNAGRKGTESWKRAFDALCANGNLVALDPLLPAKSEKGGRPASPRFRFAFRD